MSIDIAQARKDLDTAALDPELYAGALFDLAAALLDALAEAERDAGRYRWLRGESPILQTFWMHAAQSGDMVLETLDAAIDAAMSKS